jgi:hypothetical protein
LCVRLALLFLFILVVFILVGSHRQHCALVDKVRSRVVRVFAVVSRTDAVTVTARVVIQTLRLCTLLRHRMASDSSNSLLS